MKQLYKSVSIITNWNYFLVEEAINKQQVGNLS